MKATIFNADMKISIADCQLSELFTYQLRHMWSHEYVISDSFESMNFKEFLWRSHVLRYLF